MIRTDLVPHPYFNVKNPDFYKQKKLEFELNRAKYKLVNQIRKGQQEATLQNTIDEIKRRNKALQDYTREQSVLSFVRDPNAPKVFTETEEKAPPVATPARPVLIKPALPKAEPVEEEKEEEKPSPSKRGRKATKKPIVDKIIKKYKEYGLTEKDFTNINEDLTKEFLNTLDRELDAFDGDEAKTAFISQLLENKIFESIGMREVKAKQKAKQKNLEGRFKELKKPVALTGVEEEEPVPVPVAGRPKRKGISTEALSTSKRRLKKTKSKPKIKKTTSAPTLTQSEVLKRAIEARRGIISSESETEFDGDGISKKQKRILYRGSAMAGNNNKALLKKIMKI